jgi:hypothetical protein
MAMTRESGNRRNLAMALLYLGRTATKTGDLGAARSYLAESLDAFAAMGDRTDVARVLEALGTLAGASGRATRAARLLGAAECIRTAHRQPHFPFERVEYEANVAIARAGTDEAAWSAAWAAGHALTPDQAVAAARESMEER